MSDLAEPIEYDYIIIGGECGVSADDQTLDGVLMS